MPISSGGLAHVRASGPLGPQFFVPPTDGTAANGLQIFNWDQAAAQLGRQSNGWGDVSIQTTVSFGFRSTAPATMPDDTSGFVRFNDAQIAIAIEALTLWSDVANITFSRVDDGDGYTNSATMLFANYTAGVEGASAFAYYPGSTAASANAGDVWINFSLAANNSNLVAGEFGPHIMAHEIGHAIGIAHPANYNSTDDTDPTYENNAIYWQDARAYTIMSYFGSNNVGHSLDAFAAGPQLHDIAAAQFHYGANISTRTGDTTYGFNSNTGHPSMTLTADGQSPVFAIWDAGGIDTIDLSGFSTPSEIDLRTEAFSSAGPGNEGVGVAIGNIAIARGVVIENAVGGSGADTLIGNGTANELRGNAGADALDGNSGVDTAIYGVASASASFARNGSGWSVTAEGSDSLTEMEYLRFTDRNLALRPAEGSVDGAASDLVLRNASTGSVAVWQLTGSTVSSAAIVGASDTSYQAVASGDFNGDARYDILFRNSAGVLAQWQFDGAAVSGAASYGSDPAWALAGVGDFNGDHRDDILWRHSSGVMAQWQMNGLAVGATGAFAVSDTAWALAALADFNGDGHDDFLWRHSSGALAQWSVNGFTATNLGVFATSDTAWSIAGAGDFNGDLREDILWRHSSGVMALWQMDGTTASAVGTFAVSDTAWGVSDLGDYNGDGRDDILWQGPDGTFALWTMNGFTVLSSSVIGNPGAGWGDI